MKPTKCDHCGGSEFHHGPVKVGFCHWPLAIGSHFRGVYIQAAACLECGTVATYLDQPTLEALRARLDGRPRQ